MGEAAFAGRGSAPLVLTIPGLGGSGPDHWQSIWERTRGDCDRVDLGMWDNPRRNAWITKLDSAIKTAPAPVILVAHSLGCLAVAWWAALEGQPYGWPVAGALLVAPPDCAAANVTPAIGGFAPVPKVSLPFPSIVVASRNDPYAPLSRVHSMAKFWGSHFVDIGEQGHINAESRLGHWLFGQRLLDRLIANGSGRTRLNAEDIESAAAEARLPGAIAEPPSIGFTAI